MQLNKEKILLSSITQLKYSCENLSAVVARESNHGFTLIRLSYQKQHMML